MTVIDKHHIRGAIQLGVLDEPADYEPLEFVLTEPGKIKIDRNVAPAVEATLYVVSPTDLLAWDPRAFYRRVQITLLQRFGDVANFLEDLTAQHSDDTLADLTTAWAGETLADLTNQPGRYYSPTTLVPTSRTFDLVLRRVNHRLDGTTELTLRSDEILLIDRLYTRTDTGGTDGEGGAADALAITGPTQSPATFAEWLYVIVNNFVSLGLGPSTRWQSKQAEQGAAIPLRVLNAGPFSPAKAAEIAADARVPIGTNGWDMVRDLAGSLGLRVFSDGQRGLVVDTIDASTGSTLVVDQSVNLIDFEFSIDLDAPGYGAKVAARYPSDTPGDPDEFYVSIANPPGPADIYAGPGIIIDRAGTAVVETSAFKGGGIYSSLQGSRASLLAIQAPVTAVNRYTALPGDDLTIIAPSVELQGEVDVVEFSVGGAWQMIVTATNLEETP